MLASLQERLKAMHDWTQNTTTQADVKKFRLLSRICGGLWVVMWRKCAILKALQANTQTDVLVLV